MDQHSIALTDEGAQSLQLGAQGVFAGGFVREHTIQPDRLQLASGVLVEAADAHIADTLPTHLLSPPRSCQDKVLDPRQDVSE